MKHPLAILLGIAALFIVLMLAMEHHEKAALHADEEQPQAGEVASRSVRASDNTEVRFDFDAIKLIPLLHRWVAAEQLAVASPSDALAPRIRELQEIRRQVAALDLREHCMMQFRQASLVAMDTRLDYFTAVLQDSPTKPEKARLALQAWNDAKVINDSCQISKAPR